MCADDTHMISFMKKHDICTKNYKLYHSTAVIYEKNHEFKEANLIYLEGFDNKVNNIEALQSLYKEFERRMENRANREISCSLLSSEYINEYLHNELMKNNFQDPQYNANNKRLRDNETEHNFVVKKKKIHFYDSAKTSALQTTVSYGQIPVYVDEAFRGNVITKGTKVVEIYEILLKLLLEKDQQYQLKNEMFLQGLKEDYNKKPLSWINGLRIHPGKVQVLAGPGASSQFDNQERPVTEKNTMNAPKCDEDKLSSIMNKTKEEIVKKQEKYIEKMKETQAIETKKDNGTPEFNNENEQVNHLSKYLQKLIPNEGSVIHEGKDKIRIVRVETSKTESRMFLDIDKTFDEKTQQHLTVVEKRAKYYHEKLRIAKEASKSKRQTILYKFDTDGDFCMSSEKSSPLSKASRYSPSAKKIGPPVNHMKNFNLGDKNLTIEDVNEKMLEIAELFEKGQLTSEEKNSLLAQIEEKILQYEGNTRIAPSIQQKETVVNPISNTQTNHHKKQQTNNAQNNTGVTNSFIPKPDPIIHKRYAQDNDDLSTYLGPYQQQQQQLQKRSHIVNNYSTHLHNNRLQPPQPITNHPITVSKTNVDESMFSNVSRSLDFTNVKLFESNKKKFEGMHPSAAALFLADNITSIQKSDNKPKDFSFSFDSERSKQPKIEEDDHNIQKTNKPIFASDTIRDFNSSNVNHYLMADSTMTKYRVNNLI